MPICYVTLSRSVSTEIETSQFNLIRKIVAASLDSKSRLLDENHITLRIQYSDRQTMLADIEIDIFAQFFLRRHFTRDKRANKISSDIEKIFGFSCATWINLCQVGYSRVNNGQSYYSSKEDDELLRKKRKSNKQ